MSVITKNSFKLFEYAMSNNLAGNQGELCEKIGIFRENLYQIKAGKRSFTHDQLLALLQLTGASADWVYGLSKEMFRTGKKKSPMQQFNEAVATIKDLVK